MKRAEYYNYIEEKLAMLAFRIEKRGKLNILDYHIHSENFYRDFFNLIYDWKIDNANVVEQNIEAIDLIDKNNHIIVQVSATNTKKKIQDSLNKISTQKYSGFHFKFISIAKESSNLKNIAYSIPQGIVFDPKNDIYDIDLVLRHIQSFTIGKLKNVYEFIFKELGTETPTIQFESDLTNIIRLLAEEDLSITGDITIQKEFEINQKIDFNQLSNAKGLICEYMIYQSTVDNIYKSFDKLGSNKSIFVLNKIRKTYIKLKDLYSGNELFSSIITNIKNEVKSNKNIELSEEAIEMCTDILIVDAFVRCKIFENPKI